MTSTRLRVFTAPTAARLAQVSYRQLDYWARCAWVTPSVDEVGPGRPRRPRRLYRRDDVARLALLGHLGRSGFDVRAVGPTVGALEFPRADTVVVAERPDHLVVVDAASLRHEVARPGARVIFDPAPLWRRLSEETGAGNDSPSVPTERCESA